MSYLLDGLKEALVLLFTFDKEIWGVIGLSFFVSISATVISACVGIPIGFFTGIGVFPLKRLYTRVLHTLMSLPPVVVGLVVALLLSRRGPLGQFQLLFTAPAMIIAQALLVTPIITGIVFNVARKRGPLIHEVGKTLGGNKLDILRLFIFETKPEMQTAVVGGFGRALSEVGAVMVVGGNIKAHTRVMTTFIAMNNSMGNYAQSIAMALVLLTVSFTVNTIINALAREGI